MSKAAKKSSGIPIVFEALESGRCRLIWVAPCKPKWRREFLFSNYHRDGGFWWELINQPYPMYAGLYEGVVDVLGGGWPHARDMLEEEDFSVKMGVSPTKFLGQIAENKPYLNVLEPAGRYAAYQDKQDAEVEKFLAELEEKERRKTKKSGRKNKVG